MPIVEVQANGQTYEIDVPEGQDVGEAVASFSQSIGAPTQTPSAPVEDRSLGDSVMRGVGLAGRVGVGALPKLAAGIADLGGMAGNALHGAIDTGDRWIAENVFGREPREPAAPVFEGGNVENVNALLDRFFPKPEGMMERSAEMGGEMALTGGLGAIALGSRAPQVARAVPSLGDEIAQAFTQSPKTFLASEAGGGVGAQMGGELAQDADLGPVGQTVASLVGGVAGAASPAVGSRVASGGAERVRRAMEPLTTEGVERRAARELQARAGDPEAAAAAARNAPEGVTPARATEDPRLRAAERRVMEDQPQRADEVDRALEGAEARTIDEFTADLPPGQDPVDWQRRVVTRAAPEGTTITGGQPDEMLDEAFQSFRAGYSEISGYPIQTKIMQVEGGDVLMPEILGDAVGDPRVLANADTRKTVGKWLEATFDDVARRGEPVGAADEGTVQFMSEDLLEFRSAVRQKQRQLQSSGRTNPDSAAQAEILKNVDRSLTEILESQAPEAASDALKALDARYADFKTVEDAVLRGTPGDLTPQQLSQSIKMQSGSRGRVARGDTGELGTLAEQGRDVTKFLGKNGEQDQVLQRTMRSMDETQAASARADITRALADRSRTASKTSGDLRLDGNKLLKEIESNESTLRAAGFGDADINRMTQIAKRLRMIQSPDPRPDTILIDDGLSVLAGLVSRVGGAKIAKRITHHTGTGGPGVLALTGFMSRVMQKAFGELSISGAEKLLSDAMTDKELFAALLTRSTASEIKQAKARRTLNAWATQVASTDDGEE